MRRFGGLLFRVTAVHFDVAELRVRDEQTVPEEGGSQTGADGDHQHRAGLPAPGAVAHLRQAGGVGVVQHPDRTAGGLGEERFGVGADPFF